MLSVSGLSNGLALPSPSNTLVVEGPLGKRLSNAAEDFFEDDGKRWRVAELAAHLRTASVNDEVVSALARTTVGVASC